MPSGQGERLPLVAEVRSTESMLDHTEYVEQSHFFFTVAQRLHESLPLQDLLAQIREELLATTKLPLAVSFLLDELRHLGVLNTAMARLPHYFTPFQSFVMREAESDRGRFDYRIALAVLGHEAEYKSRGVNPQGVFLYQFETLCRNRLRYDQGLTAIAGDKIYDAAWRDWILTVRRRLGTVDIADMIYVCSQHYLTRRARDPDAPDEEVPTPLFGEKEGQIALANRRKDPLYLFAALQRHLGYPSIPRRKPVDEQATLVPQLLRRIEQLELRLKLLEEDQRGGFDLSKFYERPPRAGELGAGGLGAGGLDS